LSPTEAKNFHCVMVDSVVMTEKRKFHRWPCSFSCDTRIESGEYKGTVSDLSYGGARVVQTAALPLPGIPIQLTIYSDDEAQGTCLQGRVTHVSKENSFFGVQFYGNSDEVNDRLSGIIDTKLAAQFVREFSI